MDIGIEEPAITIEPVTLPIPNPPAAPTEPEPVETPEPVEEPVPA